MHQSIPQYWSKADVALTVMFATGVLSIPGAMYELGKLFASQDTSHIC